MTKAQPKIRQTIRDKKLTQCEVARRANISEAQLSQILSAKGNPTIRTLARLAAAMDRELRIRFVSTTPPLSEQERVWSLAA